MTTKRLKCLKKIDILCFEWCKMTENEKKTPETPSEEGLLLTLQRVQADFENYRKRTLHEQTQHYQRGKAAALKEILSFGDTLDAAHSKTTGADKNLLHTLRTQWLHLLSKEGVRPIETVGKIFDPFTSECLLQTHDAHVGDDVVVEELQKGYFFHDDVLRTAKVKINTRPGVAESDTNLKTTTGGNQHE